MTGFSDATTSPVNLHLQQRGAIHEAACRYLMSELRGDSLELPDEAWEGASEMVVEGAFVTLKREGHLRACCGVFGHSMNLVDAMRKAAANTALKDTRLPPISLRELPYCRLDVSLLFNFRSLSDIGAGRAEAVKIGRHGLQVTHGRQGGLLLPNVAVEHGFDADQFLEQTCRKAGLAKSAWMEPDATVTTFETVSFSGPFPERLAGDPREELGLRFGDGELAGLAEHCQRNLVAVASGATPSYYAPGGRDGHLPAIALTVHLPNAGSPLKFVQVSVRPGVPLQATLLNLTSAAAGILRQRGLAVEDLGRARVGLTLLTDVALQGDLASPDLRGIDPARHALVVIEENRTVWVYDTAVTSSELLAEIRKQAKVLHPEGAQLLTFRAWSTEPRLTLTNAPPAQAGPTIRPAAVAGSFYPADREELKRLVQKLLPTETMPKSDWPALMVPHAGLVYSGAIAARTWQRVKIPETVIVLCPKHTSYGVDWSVAPHATWDLPGARIPADPELARKLTEAIPGLQLDAAAHQREHAVEVELPWIHHFAPGARVVGIAIGTGDYSHCRQFAEGLAEVIRDLTPRPLLCISSDMNHFADDQENRRLDRLALEVMSQLDPQGLLNTVRAHEISMCGVLPAVIVMETLRQLGGLTEWEEVAYGTSADVSGDLSRVVGYAGALLR
jgi:AmmeMemoRadiSam system protein B/AmmeMemoRadiSam system protein A